MLEKFKKIGLIVSDWYNNNKELLMILIPIGLVVTGKTITALRIHGNKMADIKLKENYIYDRSLGYSLKLKHRLNSRQLSLIQMRKDSGENLIDILYSMKLLK